MKKLRLFFSYLQSKIIMVVMALMVAPALLAQDKGIDVEIGVKKESVWYQQPWAWVLGAAVFILLLVALLRSGKKE